MDDRLIQLSGRTGRTLVFDKCSLFQQGAKAMFTHNHRFVKQERKHNSPGAGELLNQAVLLLAGGDGTRLQELTSEIEGIPIPKQYCRLLNGASLLEATISRARLLFPLDRINIIMNRDHLDLAKDQVSALPESNIFVQPLNRDTGPGMIFSLLNLERAYGDATIAVFPTDHYIDKNWMFIAHVMRAINVVACLPDKIAMIGVVPDRPETGYGYILPSGSLKTTHKTFRVENFIEKPDLDAARDIISRGGLWNTFVMVFRLSRMLKLTREIVPEEFQKLAEIREMPERAAELYQNIHPWNFSTHVLAHIPQHLIVLKVANISWSDWGTRESVERTYKALNLVPFWRLAKANGGIAQANGRAQDLLKVGEPQSFATPHPR
jgi:mannose-1-phosphate guanylyltransferase